jgi:hypothetical protein
MRNIAVLVTVFVACDGAQAHHGFGTFDMNANIEITGKVTELAFVNPHSWLYLDVAEVDGRVEPYRCEMRSATTLRRSGWSPDMFPVGEQVTITGSPDRNEPHACYVSTLMFADGSSIDRYGQRTPATTLESRPRAAKRASGEPDISGDWGAEQLVMADPRGVSGALVPLGQAPDIGGDASQDQNQGQAAGARSGRSAAPPLFSPEAARRLFVARVELTETGQEAMQRMQQGVNPAMRCEPISVLVDWSYDSPVNRITQGEDTIVLEYGKFDYTRTIHMSVSEHPAGLEPSLTGHSIGRWESAVLMIDTIGFAAGALTRGLPHSDRLHFVERISLDTESMALRREFVAEDSAYFAEPYSGYDVVYPSNVAYGPSACDDRSLR